MNYQYVTVNSKEVNNGYLAKCLENLIIALEDKDIPPNNTDTDIISIEFSTGRYDIAIREH